MPWCVSVWLTPAGRGTGGERQEVFTRNLSSDAWKCKHNRLAFPESGQYNVECVIVCGKTVHNNR